MINPILTILFILNLVILFLILIYPLITKILSKNKTIKLNNKTPKITVIVPVLNEEKNIKNKLKNLLTQYRRKLMKIFVIDNGSTDKTVKIAKKFPVIILTSEKGKIKAINKGLSHAKTEIIILTDADTIMEKNAIKQLVNSFNSNIGAVNAYAVLRPNNKFYSNGKLSYHKADWNLRYNESLIDSACSLDGKLVAFKKSIVNHLSENFLCDDFLLTMLIREKGYRCIVNKNAVVYESSPSNLKEEFKQIRRRNAIGFIVVLNYLKFLFNPKYKYFSFTFTFRRFFAFFLPLLLLYPVVYIALASFKLFLFLIPLIALSIIILNYTAIQLIGLCLLWYDLLTRNFEWRKIKI